MLDEKRIEQLRDDQENLVDFVVYLDLSEQWRSDWFAKDRSQVLALGPEFSRAFIALISGVFDEDFVARHSGCRVTGVRDVPTLRP